MKTCECCGASAQDTDETCANCGEASWIASSKDVEPKAEPAERVDSRERKARR